MQGIFLHAFKQYVVRRDGPAAWDAVASFAGSHEYYATQIYPDELMVLIAQATSAHEGRDLPVVLQEFGTALVPTLLSLYEDYLDPRWRTLDLLENSESVIHRTIRMRDPDARPPHLKPLRVSDREVQIEYASVRQLCAVAMGICQGVADFYREQVTVQQPACMRSGAPACRIVVRRLT